VYSEQGSLNKAFLAQKIFSDKELIEKVNKIVHPVVREDFNVWAESQKADYVLQESAILFEIGANKLLDKIILVWAPDEMRLERVIQRDKTTPEEVLNRMKNQWPQEKKVALADFIIKNDENDMLLPQILEIHQKFKKN
jgi:dephospho-CoA kinase